MNDNTVIKFWFEELSPSQWWKKDSALDALIKKRFFELHEKAALGELVDWRDSPTGRLAEIIILDQFSRNIYRGESKAFAYDEMALALAQEAVYIKADQDLSLDKRAFMYMPYMHSESAEMHTIAMKLYSAPGLELNLAFEKKHKVIIDRFSRYPHRNAILGRLSTPDEISFLKTSDSSF